jgi:NitT/TauT family transport system substrate-binding protein
MKKMTAAALAIAAIAFITAGTWYLLALAPATPPGRPEDVVIGGPVSDAATLVFTAEDRGYFAANGLNVTLAEYPTGMAAIGAVREGMIDIAGSSEYPVVVNAFGQRDVSIIGSFSRSYNEYLVVRADRIRNVSDLRGKRIALPRHTTPEFYLGRFLEIHGMSAGDVSLVDAVPAEAVAAMENGSVDAAVAWEPFVSRLGSARNGTIGKWSVQSGQAQYSVLTARNDWIRDHPDPVRRVLVSLDQAEEHILLHPGDAKSVLKGRYGYDDSYMEAIWPDHQLTLSLDQSLVTAMEDEARWMIANNMTDAKTVPDFRAFIDKASLESVKPGSVNIIG